MPEDSTNCYEAGLNDPVWGPGQAMEESLKDAEFQRDAERGGGDF